MKQPPQINFFQIRIISASSLIGSGIGMSIAKIFIYLEIPYIWLAFAFVVIGGFALSRLDIRDYIYK